VIGKNVKSICLTQLFVLLLVVFTCYPLFRPGFFYLHDNLHPARLYTLDKSIKQGIFPVRWSSDFGYGYGMPLFNFYAPMPYYLAEIGVLLGFNLVNSLKSIFFLTVIIGALCMYKLGRKIGCLETGLIGALLYTFLPYRFLDFYVRGTLGELLVMALWPWLAWFSLKMLAVKARKAWLGASLVLGSIILSHNIYGLLTVAAYCMAMMFIALFNQSGQSRKNILLGWLRSTILALCISAFFWLPALAEKKYTIVNYFATQGYWDFHHHFLYFRQLFIPGWGYGESVSGPNDTMSFQLGLVQWTGVLIFGGYLITNWVKRKKKTVWTMALVFFILLVYLTSYHSLWVWEKIGLVQFIQFPWRLVGMMGFLACLFFMQGFSLIKNKQVKVLTVWIVGLGLLLANFSYLKPKYFYKWSDNQLDSQSIKAYSQQLVDYLPVSAVNKVSTNVALNVSEGDGLLEVFSKKENKMAVKATVITPMTIDLSINYFPGWHVLVNNQPKEYVISPSGLIRLSLLPGKYNIQAVFTNTPIRLAGNMLSLLGLLMVITLLSKPHVKKK
jgi:hypothetical protein